MENYLSYPFPDFLDIRMIIIWIGAAVIVLFLLMFILWKNKPKKAFPVIALVSVLLGLVAVPAVFFGGQAYNDMLMFNSVNENYDVVVTDSLDRFNLVVMDNGQMRSCEVNSTDQVEYYVLCEVPGGRLLLNEIKD